MERVGNSMSKHLIVTDQITVLIIKFDKRCDY